MTWPIPTSSHITKMYPKPFIEMSYYLIKKNLDLQ